MAASALDEKKLVLGRGQVFFDEFTPGTYTGRGERYIGNTPSFRIQREVERVSRFGSVRGRKVEKSGVVVGETHTVDFTTDQISIENIGLFYGNPTETVTNQVAAYRSKETLQVIRGRFYQLGKTTFPVIGVNNIDYVTVEKNGVQVDRDSNYRLDKANGRIEILGTATAIQDNDLIDVYFEWRDNTEEKVSAEPTEVIGSLRYVATNPYGPRKNYLFPFVRISPRGQVELKGDQWQQIGFQVTALSLSPNIKQMYVEQVVSSGNTSDESAILEDVSYAEFITLENLLWQYAEDLDLALGPTPEHLTADNTLFTADNTEITADQAYIVPE